MLQIAICDDTITELEREARLVEDYLAARPELDGTVRCFQAAYDLVDCLRSRGGFDAYLLDIMMPYMDGIELGRAIRETGDRSPIVYLTSSPDYAVDSYEVEAFKYLLKPVAPDKLAAVLDKLTATVLAATEKPVAVRIRDGVVSVLPSHLLYVHIRDHVLYYHLDDGRVVESITVRESFEQVCAPLLEDERFLKISVNHVINMSFVVSLAGGRFTMRDGAELTIPRRGAAEVKLAYMEYIIRRGRGVQV